MSWRNQSAAHPSSHLTQPLPADLIWGFASCVQSTAALHMAHVVIRYRMPNASTVGVPYAPLDSSDEDAAGLSCFALATAARLSDFDLPQAANALALNNRSMSHLVCLTLSALLRPMQNHRGSAQSEFNSLSISQRESRGVSGKKCRQRFCSDSWSGLASLVHAAHAATIHMTS